MHIDIIKAEAALAARNCWDEWIVKSPPLQFPSDWKIKIVPPFMGAIVRFMVIREDGDAISVYLDGNSNLGFYGNAYWEVYPVNNDTARFYWEDTKALIDCIQKELDKQ